MKSKLLIIVILFSLLVPVELLYAGRKSVYFYGKLSRGGTAVKGTKIMQARIFNASSGGTLLGSTGNRSVTLGGNGSFSIELPTNISWENTDRYLELVVAGNTLSPRVEIGSYPSGLTSFQLEDKTKGDFITDSSSDTLTNKTIDADNNTLKDIAASAISSNTLDYTKFEDTLDLDASTETNLGAYNLTFDLDSTGDLVISDAGTATHIFKDDGTVGLGTTSPVSKLTIQGYPSIAQDPSSATTSDGYILLGKNSSETGGPVSGWEYLRYDSSNNRFAFSAPLYVPSASPAITFYDPSTGSTKAITYDATNNNISVGDGFKSFFGGGDGNPANSATKCFFLIGNQNLSSGSSSGTFIGANAPSDFGGNLVHLQKAGVTRFQITNNGDIIIQNPTLTGASDGGPILNTSQGWNNAARTFTAWKLNITDTNSATASLLMDLQVGASSKFKVRKDGAIIFADGTIQTTASTGSISGTANYIPKFTGITAIGDSVMYETSNKIGIGTTTPSHKLQIADSDTTASRAGLYVSQTGGITGTGYGGYFTKTGASTTNVGLYATASGATNNYAAIFEAGNVGIGTTVPDGLFDVTGSDGDIYIDATGTELRMRKGTDVFQLTIATYPKIGTVNNDKFGLKTFGSERVTIDNAGNVGIGTTAPDGLLELAGNKTATAWGLNGIQLQSTAATYTDSSTAASGTATNAVFTSFGQPTLAATNTSVTTTNAATVYIANAPTATPATNQTITNPYALWVDDGTVRFDGTVNFSGGNTWTLGAGNSLTIDGATTDNTTTAGVLDIDVDSSTNANVGIDLNYEGTGTTALATQNAFNLTLVPSNTINARTYRGLNLSASDAGAVANTLVGLNIDVTTANTSDTTYAAIFQGGNVGIGTTAPGDTLDVSGSISVTNANVAHGVTDRLPTNAYGRLKIISSTDGGLDIIGASDVVGQQGLTVWGIIGAADPTDTVPALIIQGSKGGTTGGQALGSAETVLDVRNHGTKLMTILGNGSVGIGTTAPDNKLHIKGSVNNASLKVEAYDNTDSLFTVNSASDHGDVIIYKDGGSVGIRLLASGDSYFNNGDVGIGTTNPSNPLEISSSTAGVNSALALYNPNNDLAGRGSALEYFIADSLGNRDRAGILSVEFSDHTATSEDADLDLWLMNAGTLEQKLIVKGAGSVGIGTTAPYTILEAATATPAARGITMSYYNNNIQGPLFISRKSRGATVGSHTAVQSGDTLGAWNSLGSDGTTFINAASIYSRVDGAVSTNDVPGRIEFLTRPSGGADVVEAMRIDDDGNVGIGTTAPDGLLELAGNRTTSAWGLNGIQLQSTAATYTDSSTAASGTATNAVFTSFGQPTLAATNAGVTTTNAATVYIANAPTAGTNQTIGNAYALWVDDGTARFDGTVNFSGGNTWTLGASNKLTIDAATTDTTTTAGVLDIDVDSSTNANVGIDLNYEGTGTTALATQNAFNLTLVPSNTINARTYRGLNLSASDAGAVANSLVGLNIDVTTANTSDTTYAAIFQGGFVGIGTTAPGTELEIGDGTGSPNLTISGGDADYDNASLVLESHNNSNDRALGIYMYNDDAADEEWFIGRPYDTNNDSFVINRKTGMTNHDNSTANEALYNLITIDSSGNVGIGTANLAPWATALSPSIESTDTSISFGDDTDIHMTSNAYLNAIDALWRYKTTDLAANYYQYKGTHNWRVAASGTAAATVTWMNAMSILSSGDVGIGTGTQIHQLHIEDSDTTANRAGLYVSQTGAIGGGGTGYAGYFSKIGASAVNVGLYATASGAASNYAAIFESGNVGIGMTNPDAQLDLSTDSARKLTTNTWSTGSDERIKTNIKEITDALKVLTKIRPIKFNYNSDFLAVHPSVKHIDYYNFIAQEYQKVFPDSVTKGNDGLLYLNTSNMIPYAIAAIKELDERTKGVGPKESEITKEGDVVFRNERDNGDIIFEGTQTGKSTEFMRIDGKTGYVGIGTEIPTTSLDVKGTIKSSGSDFSWTTMNLGKGFELSQGNALVWDKGDTGTISRGITVSNNNMYFIRSEAEDSSGEAVIDMVIDENGNVGIGTSDTEGYKLYVNGDIYSNGTISSSKGYIGYTISRFINSSGKTLSRGDLVKIKPTGITSFTGVDNLIPIAEVTLTEDDDEYGVIGIVLGNGDESTVPTGDYVEVVTGGVFAVCKVMGEVNAGALLVSSTDGYAKEADKNENNYVAMALEPNDPETGTSGYISVLLK